MNNYRQNLLKEMNVFEPENKILSSYWYHLSGNRKLSEKFMREFKDELYWKPISRKQVLSEDFIREFKDYIDWQYASYCQNLSTAFLIEFKKEIHWNDYFYELEIEFEFMKQYILKSNFTDIYQFKSNHLNDAQKQEIQKLLNLKYHLIQ